MRRLLKIAVLTLTVVTGTFVIAPQSDAASCVNGVYRAGCTGPNGTVAVRKAPAYHANPVVHCVNGVYRAGCVGPNGATAVRK